jgi:hypothetical protein
MLVCLSYKQFIIVSNLLLLHELGVGAVIDNILAKDGSGENSVNLLGTDIL